MIVAPTIVRPAENYGIFVTIYRIRSDDVNVRMAIVSDGKSHASTESLFTEPSSRLVQIIVIWFNYFCHYTLYVRLRDLNPFEQVPENLESKNYSLRVEGVTSRSQGRLFFNETELVFQQKFVSIFVETDKPFYRRFDTPGSKQNMLF